MLVLTRRIGDSVTIRLEDGRTIEVIVAKITGKSQHSNRVQLGFIADRSIQIVRDNAKVKTSTPQ